MSQNLNLKLVDLNKICRLCLTTKEEMEPIQKTDVPRMVASFTSIKINLDPDDFPKLACYECREIATLITENIRQMEETNAFLLKHFRDNESKRDDKKNNLTKDKRNEVDESNVEMYSLSGNISHQTKPKNKKNQLKKSTSKQENLRMRKLPNTLTKQMIEMIVGEPVKSLHDYASTSEINDDTIRKIATQTERGSLLLRLLSNNPVVDLNTFKLKPTANFQMFTCDICLRPQRLSRYWMHRCSHDYEFNQLRKTLATFTCKVCRVKTCSRKTLNEHVKSVHGDVAVKTRCNMCSTVVENMDLHVKNTHETTFTCPMCAKKFAVKGRLTRHISFVHEHKRDKTPKFLCNECGAVLKSKVASEHHALMHRGEKPFKCGKCHARFRCLSHVKSHERAVHDCLKPFECAVCLKTFNRKQNVVGHMAVHTGEKPFECVLCSVSFRFKSSLTVHVRKVHGSL